MSATDPYAHLRPAAADPKDRLYTVAVWTFVISLLLFPAALVSLALGFKLISRDQISRGVTLSVLSLVVLVVGFVVVAGSV